MATDQKGNKIRVITVGPEDHKRLKIMAASYGKQLRELIAEFITRQWEEFKRKEEKLNVK